VRTSCEQARERFSLQLDDELSAHEALLLERHLDRAERRQVRRVPLDVEQRHAALAHHPDERHERHLRRVALRVEHRLAGEQPRDADAVQAAGEPSAPIEDLDAVRPSEAVQHRVRVDERRRDPAALARRIGARANHLLEAGVDANVVALRALAQRAQREVRSADGDRYPGHDAFSRFEALGAT